MKEKSGDLKGAAATYATWFGPSQAREAGTGPVEAVWSAPLHGALAVGDYGIILRGTR